MTRCKRDSANAMRGGPINARPIVANAAGTNDIASTPSISLGNPVIFLSNMRRIRTSTGE
jgi:hypothetical protein